MVASTSIRLAKVRYWLLGCLLFSAPLSLHPSISLPLFNFPSFRIGLYQLFAALFVATALPLVVTYLRDECTKHRYVLWGSLAFLVALCWGLATTVDSARSTLYSVSLLSLVILALAAYCTLRTLSEPQRQAVIPILLWSGVIFGGLALLELGLIASGLVPVEILCRGCTSSVFGFPRVNLTAAEPQFLANSLLPALCAGMLFRDTRHRWLAPVSLLVTSAAIAVTFSRGAYVAIAGTCAVYLAIVLWKKMRGEIRHAVQSIVTVGIGFVVGLLCLIGAASHLYRDTPYIAYNTSVSALSHLTLGFITLPEVHAQPIPQPQPQATPQPEEVFDPVGFVAASSNDRLTAAETALAAWDDTPLTIMFGVGMGNLGGYVRTHHVPNAPADLTVYVFYVLLLVELGLVGLLLLLITLLVIIRNAVRDIHTTWGRFGLLLTVAFAIQLAFFGSYINVMYMYVWFGIFLALPRTSKTRIIKASYAK